MQSSASAVEERAIMAHALELISVSPFHSYYLCDREVSSSSCHHHAHEDRDNFITTSRSASIGSGTTYSCVAVWRHGRVEICPNELGNRITPSYVAFQADKATGGTRLVGDAAKNQAAQNPANTVFDVKRLIGARYPILWYRLI